ncbi:MAG TPA: hypothetical protein EYG92_06130 [Lutibacter sp.]|nr:hypothetical protein [Lutibacter sp.]
MQQKIIWIVVLTFGILISFQSCKKNTDGVSIEEFYYINNSDYDIVINAFNNTDSGYIGNTYNLPVNGDFSQEIESMFGSKTGVVALCDSVSVVFGSNRIEHFLPNTESFFNILNHNNYEYFKKDKNHNSYTYSFTNDDYENAIDME